MPPLASFADLFTRPTWTHIPLLLAGAILAPGRRTVAAALRILGRILNRAAWSSRAAAAKLLLLLISAFLPAAAPVVIGLERQHRAALGCQNQRARHLP